ncbi:MAG: phosphoserine phosphatase SerB [Nitrospinaceae bacterium]
MKIGIYPWDRDNRPEAPYAHRSVVTLLGARIESNVLRELTQTLASRDINILRIEQLDYGDQHVLEFVIGTRQVHSEIDVLNAMVRFKEKFQVDIAVQDDTLFRRNKRLIVFDADMTFLQCEVIDELGRLAGAGEKMAGLTNQAMTGNQDFTTALEKRVELLRGLPVERLEELFHRIPLTPGAEDLVRILKYLGFKIALVSGGFQFFISKLREKYHLDYGFANTLKIVDGRVVGRLEGEIIDARAKERILVSLAKQEGISLQQVVAVGDGANDILMLARAGLGIAFNAKPIVQQHARASINRSNLELILYFLGYNGKDLKELREVAVKREGSGIPDGTGKDGK